MYTLLQVYLNVVFLLAQCVIFEGNTYYVSSSADKPDFRGAMVNINPIKFFFIFYQYNFPVESNVKSACNKFPYCTSANIVKICEVIRETGSF